MRNSVHYCAAFAIAAALLVPAGCGSISAPISSTQSGDQGGSNPGNPIQPVQLAKGEWTWASGSSNYNQYGVYGALGVPAPGNTPGARLSAVSFTDKAGNLWLFGGFGIAASSGGDLNDLWEYSNGQWTWIGGSNQSEQAGVYGTQGVPAPGNVPGARWEAAGWTDPQGNFWLFGGLGIDSTGTRGYLNDLWRYSNGQWAWMAGSPTVDEGSTSSERIDSVYGTQGAPSPANTPGARVDAAVCTDSSGNLWLFGGSGWDSVGNGGNLNDLWRYSNGEWTWMAGSNLVDQPGIYGTEGTPAPGNTPGSRWDASAWTDAAGNLWLFSGEGASSAGVTCPVGPCYLNDLWEYIPGSGWAWMGGTSTYNQPGVYGTEGAPAPSNIPGGRTGAASFTDPAGNFWLFGGNGCDSTGCPAPLGGLNDLWKFSNGQWTWMSGSNVAGQPGIYGTQGTAAPSNVPGCRDGAVGWADASGNLWIFGGEHIYCLGNGDFNDLWVYQP